MSLRKGDIVSLDIETLAYGGHGIAKVDGIVVFVDGAIPGQVVKARISRKRKGYREAKLLEVTAVSSDQVEAKCQHFGECGGCRFQHLDYQMQIKYKEQQVRESLEHIGGLRQPAVASILASPDRFYYRNKMEFSFGSQRWVSQKEIDRDDFTKPKDFALGLHVRGRFDKILDLDECFLQSTESTEIVNLVRDFASQNDLRPYSTRDHTGFLRHLVIREGKNTDERMVNLVTSGDERYYGRVDELAERLAAAQKLTTFVHNINRGKAQVATGDEERVLFGEGTIRERIGGKIFQISANSFFQTNSRGAEVLYCKVSELSDFSGTETVYDLYCGAGTISIYIADQVAQVVGFEIVKDAIVDARRNCLLNGVENCDFIPGDLRDTLKNYAADRSPSCATVLIIDPPRAGMHADVMREVLKLRPPKIIYVSCNPTTFARDAAELCKSYDLKLVQPIDMFPMTSHIELVSLFQVH